MTTYLARDKWTSTDASGVTLTGAELVGPAFHWPGTSQKIIGVESQAQTAGRLRGYRNFHVTGRGWRDIGYNVAFDQAGRVWMLRSTTWAGSLVGAHCASPSNPRANHKYVGCLLILGADERPSAAMLEAINDWYHTRFLARWFGRTDARGHGQVPGASTTCQGPHVRAALAAGTIPGGPQEDDMEATDDIKLTPGMKATLGGHDELSVGSLLGYGGAGGFRYMQDRSGLLTNQAKTLAELAAIRAAVNAEPVDVAALAQQIAALLVPVISEEFEGLPGVTLEAIEAANERVTRRVLGSLDAA